MKPSLNISIINETDGFFRLEEEWNELLAKSCSDTIFLRWEWLYHWWLAYGDDVGELFIVLAREDEKLVGIAPVYLHKQLRGFYREIRFLGSNVVCSDYLDFILRKGREQEVLTEILAVFVKNNKLWDAAHFTDIPALSGSVPYIEGFFKTHKVMIDREYTVCPYLDLSSSWESIYASYASVLKNTIKRKVSQFEKLSQAGYEEISSAAEMKEAFPRFLELNASRLKEKKIKSPFRDKSFLSFHENIIFELGNKDMAKLCFLKAEGDYIAGMYLLTYNGVYYYYQSGLDPSWQQISPGALLFHYCIRSAQGKGIREFDFLQGDESYKRQWTPRQRVNIRISVFNRNMRGVVKGRWQAEKNRVKGWLRTMKSGERKS